MRQIALDTETTGLDPKSGHKIIEIGCVEILNRKITGQAFQVYCNPERHVDAGAFAVHGLGDDFLQDKPLFGAIADDLLAFMQGAEIIIHNAPFDLGFLNHELQATRAKLQNIDANFSIIDTLALARKMHPGQRNSLDALCKRYHVDNSSRDLHGALLDADLLAQVYLNMTGGQATLFIDDQLQQKPNHQQSAIAQHELADTPVLKANTHELTMHEKYLRQLDQQSSGQCLWHQINGDRNEST